MKKFLWKQNYWKISYKNEIIWKISFKIEIFEKLSTLFFQKIYISSYGNFLFHMCLCCCWNRVLTLLLYLAHYLSFTFFGCSTFSSCILFLFYSCSCPFWQRCQMTWSPLKFIVKYLHTPTVIHIDFLFILQTYSFIISLICCFLIFALFILYAFLLRVFCFYRYILWWNKNTKE